MVAMAAVTVMMLLTKMAQLILEAVAEALEILRVVLVQAGRELLSFVIPLQQHQRLPSDKVVSTQQLVKLRHLTQSMHSIYLDLLSI